MTGGIIEAVLGEIAIVAGKAGLRRLLKLPAVQQAVEDTVLALSGVEGGDALEAWLDSQEFEAFDAAVVDGQRTITEADVQGFIASSGFFAGDQTTEKAREVLETFLGCLVHRLHETDGFTIIEKHATHLHVEGETQAQARHEELLATIRQRMPPTTLPVSPDETPPEPGEEAYASRADEARRLLRSGKFATAEGILRRLDDELREAEGSSSLRARIAVNLGVCRLQRGDFDEAEEQFTRALGLRRPFAKAENGFALLCLNAGRFNEAVQHAESSLSLDGYDADAAAIRLIALESLGERDQVDVLLATPEWVGDSPVRALAMGEVLFRRERHAESAEILTRAVALNPDEPQAHALLALALFLPVQQEFRLDTPLPWRLPEQAKQILGEAVKSATRAIEILTDYEAEARLCDALVQRGAILATMSRDDEALSDFDRVLALDPNHPMALRDRGMVLLQAGKHAEAVACIERARAAGPEDGVGALLAICHLALGRPEAAVDDLVPLWHPASDDETLVSVGALLVRAYDEAGRNDMADDVEAQIFATWPANPVALAAVADRRGRAGDHRAAADLLIEAIANLGGRPEDTLKLQLADEYVSLKQWADAAELYEQVVDRSRANPPLARYVMSLYNSGRYADARSVARALRENHGATPTITEIEARVEEYVGNLASAIELYLQLDRVAPSSPEYRLHAAVLCVQQGDRKQATKLIQGVRAEDAWNQPVLLMQLAQLRHELAEPEALPAAYQARRVGMDDPEIHLAYFGLMLHRDEIPVPGVVSIDSTVTLSRKDERLDFTILDDPTAGRERREIPARDPLAQRLLGKAVGDELVLTQDTPRGPVYEITEIRSKYVSAYQETLVNFMIWFPEHAGLRRVDAEDGDLSELLLTIDRGDTRDRMLLDLYLKGPVPIGAVAQLSGRTDIEVWGEMTGEPDAHFLVASGSLQELTEGLQAIADEQSLVLDITSALTVSFLGLGEQLATAFRHLFVSQAVTDVVNNTLRSRFGLRRPAMSLSKEGGRYVRRELTEESYGQGRDFLEGLREFLQTKCETVPHESVLDMDAARYDQLRGLFGEPGITSVLVAAGLGHVLYCDDAPLRNVAEAGWSVRCVSTQAILRDMQRRTEFTEDEYSAAIERLMLAQYRHLSVGVRDIVHALESASMGITPGVLALFEALHGPVCTQESAVQVAGGVLLHVWARPIPIQIKMLMLDLALASVMKGRSRNAVATMLKQELSRRFAATPLALAPIFETIDLWVRLNRLGARA